jgi:hypothetical protein
MPISTHFAPFPLILLSRVQQCCTGDSFVVPKKYHRRLVMGTSHRRQSLCSHRTAKLSGRLYISDTSGAFCTWTAMPARILGKQGRRRARRLLEPYAVAAAAPIVDGSSSIGAIGHCAASLCVTLAPKPTLKSLPSIHMRCRMPASFRATATIAHSMLDRLATRRPQARSADHFLTRSSRLAACFAKRLPDTDIALFGNAPLIVDRGARLMTPGPKCAPTVRDRVKRKGSSTPTLNESAATGPTPGTVINRRQI